jgi:putative endonuclease
MRRVYVGVTEDVDRRHAQHERGNVRSTKAYRPWKVAHVERYATKAEALRRERYLKSPAGWLEKRQLAGL